ncbi:MULTISPECIES: hypothetical protein [Brucella]|uniref:hypothetical protein n=1 Tax=Brucella TaxID=234 RepID=UPI002165C0B6|nr:MULTISPECIES: hypothetical protein [Brucella]MDL2201307.1 hypothetical protein [Brucella intermedia]UVV69192.1 hypothetical protein NW321_19850 [Brucella anthropi]
MGAERLLCCFKYEDAEVFVQRVDPCADVGLVDATRPWGTVETQMSATAIVWISDGEKMQPPTS